MPERSFAISALGGEGCQPLVYAIMEYLERVGQEPEQAAPPQDAGGQ